MQFLTSFSLISFVRLVFGSCRFLSNALLFYGDFLSSTSSERKEFLRGVRYCIKDLIALVLLLR